MRFIDTETICEQLPNGWAEKAQQAHDEVRTLSTDARSKAINEKSDIWKELKDVLKGASHGKCWYCESRQERSDNAVDHYRPKNKVAECTDHDGYWWLAFRWSNYRFSCTFCNSRRVDQVHGTSGGKHDHFPLWDDSRRVFAEDGDISTEQSLLLDPIRCEDPPHLWFDEDGQATPNPRLCTDKSSYPYKRAETSIEKYHLNHVDAVERRKLICQSIRKSVQEADVFYDKYSTGDMTAKASFANSVSQVHKKLKADAEYSAAARATLMGLRGTSAVAEIILTQG